MLQNRVCLAIFVSVVLPACSALSYGEDQDQVIRLTPSTQFSGRVNRLSPLPPKPPVDFTLRVWVTRNTPATQVNRYQKIADFMNSARLGVPNDRIEYFATHISPKSPAVIGWSGAIEDVTSIKGGVIVTLRVNSKQDAGLDTLGLTEQYSIINGKIAYMGCFGVPEPKRLQFLF